ncbi:MAG: PKD domain-containing protein [Candidatus Magnetoglobus multicellularis str. Araruama]|uniref:PKD domain-containing protein n=1 Tax=Candidatus Magnetoglobus multicellularis str. Araruama TaxID=890399 RepID=A0A1V1NYJ1_9BACT|nr:MAG: PKD domain-containing protein [Candidatus Magnetoglobus multicellularis str. Araruama]
MASDAEEEDRFGFSVCISGNYAIVGAVYNDDNGSKSGSAYIFKQLDNSWTEQIKLLASNGDKGDRFGKSVAISENYAIVGSFTDYNGSSSGSVYIFKKAEDTWIEQKELHASDAEGLDYFGTSVAISKDYIIVGASGNDDNGKDSGSAYIFRRDVNNWIEESKLLASDGVRNDNFGKSVSIYEEYAIVGTEIVNLGSQGSAYIFKRAILDEPAWIEQKVLTASNGSQYDRFGYSVSISKSYAFVGTYGNSVYSYKHSLLNEKPILAVFTQYKELTSDAGTISINIANMGTGSMKWSAASDVEWLTINSGNQGVDSGLIDISYEQNKWNDRKAIITITSPDAVNSPQYIRVLQSKTVLLASDGAEGNAFGSSVDIESDYAIVGATNDDVNGYRSGSAYIFAIVGGTWVEQSKLIPSDGAELDLFGCSVSISGNYAIVGAYQDDDVGKIQALLIFLREMVIFGWNRKNSYPLKVIVVLVFQFQYPVIMPL